jgi:hypothetical protein
MIDNESEMSYVARKYFGIRINFWGVKFLWHRERHYVAIPYMAVWLSLACLAPDMPDGWSFADANDWSSHQNIFVQFQKQKQKKI